MYLFCVCVCVQNIFWQERALLMGHNLPCEILLLSTVLQFFSVNCFGLEPISAAEFFKPLKKHRQQSKPHAISLHIFYNVTILSLSYSIPECGEQTTFYFTFSNETFLLMIINLSRRYLARSNTIHCVLSKGHQCFMANVPAEC